MGGSFIGSLGFASACGFAAISFAAFGAATDDGFLAAGVSAAALGFGAVIDGKGGDATADDDMPVLIQNHKSFNTICLGKTFEMALNQIVWHTLSWCRFFRWLSWFFFSKISDNRIFNANHFLSCTLN